MRVFFSTLSLLLGFFSVQIEAEERAVNVAGWGTPSQSAPFYDWYPQKALDMNPSTCMQTPTENNPWWKLDLLKVYSVNRVVITNRDIYSERINGAEIRVGNVSSDVFSNPICAVISSIPAGASFNFFCNRMEGRYLFVVIHGPSQILTLCEVKVYVVYSGNLAIGRSVTQSSTYESWIAEKAIDFNPGFFPQPSLACSSTGNQTNPWWRLDLRDTYRVSKVVVTNRRDCCPEQIIGAEIRIGNFLDNNGNNNPVCAVISSIPAGVSSTYACNDMEGRYVNLIIPGDLGILTLCEVEVYGEGNLAAGGSVTQSSTTGSWITEQPIDFSPGNLAADGSVTQSSTTGSWITEQPIDFSPVPYVKQTFVKLKLKSSLSLSNAAVRVRLLKQLESVLAGKGISNVKLRWSQLPEKEVMRKEAAPAQCAQRRKR